MASSMRALRLHERGGADRIVVEDAPVPAPAIGDVLVQVDAASITPTELGWPSTWVDRTGADRTPVIPGHEVCGTVVALGYGTSGFAPGDEVFGLTDWYRDGATAELVAVEARNLARKPARCTPIEAASLPLAALTAWQALFDHGGMARGDTVVVTGATGGVGVFALQLAAAAGARVVAVARPDRADAARELGATEIVTADGEGWARDLGDVDLVVDFVGGAVLDTLIDGAGAKRAVSVVAPGDGIDFFVVEADRPTLTELARRVEAASLRPVVGEVVPLADGADAFGSDLRPIGKRVIAVR
ncbi:MAG TPA: NADP-dependent oxidoreductase [Acidimicrobiia bacterium]|jgi:NADPH:quinone reductase-like Zn-dependent oxidoreductase